MPTNVPLNEDGMEDPEEFFRSSPTTSPMASTSRRTTMGGASVAPSSVGQSRRLTKGRMSQLDGSDDDEMNLGYNALDDDDERKLQMLGHFCIQTDDAVGDNSYFGPSSQVLCCTRREEKLTEQIPRLCLCPADRSLDRLLLTRTSTICHRHPSREPSRP